MIAKLCELSFESLLTNLLVLRVDEVSAGVEPPAGAEGGQVRRPARQGVDTHLAGRVVSSGHDHLRVQLYGAGQTGAE